MRKWTVIAAVFFIAGLTQTIIACSSSDAHQGPSQEAFETLQKQVTSLQTMLNDVNTDLSGVERDLGPRVVQETSSTERRAEGSHELRIAQFSPVYYDGPDCTGNAYISVGDMGESGARQGFVFMLRDPNDITGTESPYMMVAPGTPRTDATWQSSGGGGCNNITPIQRGGYAVVPNDEAVCDVPARGIPARMWPQGSMLNSAQQEVWTAKSCITFVPSEVIPKVLVGASE